MIGIYKIKNKVNGKVYIGQSMDIERRWRDHIRMLKNKTHHSTKLQRSWTKSKEGTFMFEVVEECDKNLLDERENYYINKYDSIENGYNMVGIYDNIGYMTDKRIRNLKAKTKKEFEYNKFMDMLDGLSLNFSGKVFMNKMCNMEYSKGVYEKFNKLLCYVSEIQHEGLEVGFIKNKPTIILNKSPYEYIVIGDNKNELLRYKGLDVECVINIG